MLSKQRSNCWDAKQTKGIWVVGLKSTVHVNQAIAGMLSQQTTGIWVSQALCTGSNMGSGSEEHCAPQPSNCWDAFPTDDRYMGSGSEEHCAPQPSNCWVLSKQTKGIWVVGLKSTVHLNQAIAGMLSKQTKGIWVVGLKSTEEHCAPQPSNCWDAFQTDEGIWVVGLKSTVHLNQAIAGMLSKQTKGIWDAFQTDER